MNLIRTLVVAAVVALTGCATTGVSADLVFKKGSNTVTLHHEPCNDTVKAMGKAMGAEPDLLDKLSNATVVWGGKTIQACWMPHPQDPKGHVYIIDETGDGGPMERSKFSKADTF